MIVGRRYQLLLLIFVCLGLYYPVLFNTTLSIDDVDMVQRMQGATFNWQRLFSPRSSFYYRPLLILTFWFDKWLWDFYPTFSLFENALLHVLNVVLVYLIADRFFDHVRKFNYGAFCAALIFAVHPIATESINWMSGRTDLLATFFVLLSILILHYALKQGSYLQLLLSLAVYLCAIMSKEVVIFFLPAAVYLMVVRYRENYKWNFNSLFIPVVTFLSPVSGGAIIYIIYRLARFSGSAKSIHYLIERMPYEGLDFLRVPLKVFGFYAKKLFIPWPLNFAIVSVSDYYVLLGVIVFLIMCWVAFRFSSRWAFVVLSFYMISPAIIIAMTHIAWTPVAERYIYLSSAFLAIGLLFVFVPLLEQQRWLRLVVVFLVFWSLPAAAITLHRSLLWQDKEAFYADTLQKSPSFNRVRNEYGVALLSNGRSDQALVQFEQGQSSQGTYYALVNEARLLLIEGDFEKARAVLFEEYSDVEKMRIQALKMLAHINVKRLQQATELAEIEKIKKELFAVHSLIYKKSHDPFYLYRSGQLALSLGEKNQAQNFFARAYRQAPDTAHYKVAAGKLAEKLKKEM